jgi:hypothetical protein
MAKEWILNSAMNRFQLNFKRNVGATSESIRKCSPKTVEEWRNYYYKNVCTEEHIEELGKKLYVKITEVIQSEVEDITEEDCINYMKQFVIDRTFDGYTTEISTIYGQLQKELNCKIEPVNQGVQLPEIYKEYKLQKDSHVEFKEKFGGNVFYIFSTKTDGKKEIVNKEVIDEIKKEIKRLS